MTRLALFPTAGPRRAVLPAVAVLGTAAYAGSFALAGAYQREAAAVGVAAGLSWPVFGAVLLWLTRVRPSAGAWAEACLRVMAVGMAVLAAAAAANAAAWLGVTPRLPWAVHVLILSASNVLMLLAFVRQAKPLGLRPARAAAAWLVALDGTFALLLAVLL